MDPDPETVIFLALGFGSEKIADPERITLKLGRIIMNFNIVFLLMHTYKNMPREVV